MHCLLFETVNNKYFFNTSPLDYEVYSVVLLLFTCYAVTEPGVPYNVTVRARTAAGKGEPVSIVVFAVQQGDIEQVAEDCGQRVVVLICIQRIQLHYFTCTVYECATIIICCLSYPFSLVTSSSSAHPAPTAQVSNVKVKWVNNNIAALVSWTPLTLHQARGFPVYFVTYQPSSQVGRVARAVSTVNTTDSSVLIGNLDSTTEYNFTVDVGTAGGEVQGTLPAGQCMFQWKNCYKWMLAMFLANIYIFCI